MTLNMTLNRTHDPARRSWIESANEIASDFPLQNLPYGVFRKSQDTTPHIGVAIGNQILDLYETSAAGLLPSVLKSSGTEPTLNGLMTRGPAAWGELRSQLSELLGADSCPVTSRTQVQRCLVPMAEAEMLLPAAIGGYTDFYASRFHAANVGSMFRPGQPLLPNYPWVPIGYHGRSSSIGVSGTPVRRPHGQIRSDGTTAPTFGPCRNLDYELELGAFVGPGNPPGEPIPVARAAGHLFGVVLLNDWSARDIQQWESQPLGPFLAKNFATTISPWIVTMEALAPFRVPACHRPAGDPLPLSYLSDPADQAAGGLDVTVEAWLQTPGRRETGQPPHRLSSGSFQTMYWTLAQLLTHHASNGCNLQPGDLLGSGTISGETKGSRGCLLELTWLGTDPLMLPGGEPRRFLEDGDEVILRGYCERAGARRIGLGECRGLILPAGP
jgi:fumarylacetoacetase